MAEGLCRGLPCLSRAWPHVVRAGQLGLLGLGLAGSQAWERACTHRCVSVIPVRSTRPGPGVRARPQRVSMRPHIHAVQDNTGRCPHWPLPAGTEVEVACRAHRLDAPSSAEDPVPKHTSRSQSRWGRPSPGRLTSLWPLGPSAGEASVPPQGGQHPLLPGPWPGAVGSGAMARTSTRAQTLSRPAHQSGCWWAADSDRRDWDGTPTRGALSRGWERAPGEVSGAEAPCAEGSC